MLGVKARCNLWALVVEAQPLLDAAESGALGQVRQQYQVQRERSSKDRVPAQEVDLHLHRVAEPAEDVDVVPALFVVAARRVVVERALGRTLLVPDLEVAEFLKLKFFF